MFALTLIRHGETLHNKDKVIQGQTDVPLSSTGIEQAELLGKHLQDQRFTHVYTSDLSRAKQTALCILEKSRVSNGPLLEDSRLRERKFGAVEGKSFKYLKEASSKANKSVSSFTPIGAETVQQVRNRAVLFFKDLCNFLKESKGITESDNTPLVDAGATSPEAEETEQFSSPSKRKREDSLTQKNKKFDICEDNQIGSFNNHSENSDSSPSANTTSVPSPSDHHSSASVDVNNQTNSISRDTNDVNGANDNCPSSVPCNGNDASDATTSPDDICSNSPRALQNAGCLSLTFADDMIRSSLNPSKNETDPADCPNVSLSPLVEQCLTDQSGPFSTLRSNENHSRSERKLSVCSSNDDPENTPILIASVLVISHGGLLRELIRYFVEDLGCCVPGGKKQALRISPNAGLSKFTVSLSYDNNELPKIICHQIHDKQHLASLFSQEPTKLEDTAL